MKRKIFPLKIQTKQKLTSNPKDGAFKIAANIAGHKRAHTSANYVRIFRFKHG